MGDGQLLELIPAPKKAERPSDLASSFNHIGVRVSDLDEVYARALANGAKPHPLHDGSGGVWDGRNGHHAQGAHRHFSDLSWFVRHTC